MRALVFEDRRRTFAELPDRVARLAGALRELGVARGDRVAVLSLNQDRYTELFLGVAWAGAVDTLGGEPASGPPELTRPGAEASAASRA